MLNLKPRSDAGRQAEVRVSRVPDSNIQYRFPACAPTTGLFCDLHTQVQGRRTATPVMLQTQVPAMRERIAESHVEDELAQEADGDEAAGETPERLHAQEQRRRTVRKKAAETSAAGLFKQTAFPQSEPFAGSMLIEEVLHTQEQRRRTVREKSAEISAGEELVRLARPESEPGSTSEDSVEVLRGKASPGEAYPRKPRHLDSTEDQGNS